MYKKFKAFFLIAIVSIAIFSFSMPCSAYTPREATESVVMVYQEFSQLDGNGQRVDVSGWGTGFAIGKIGEPIQFIVTNFHVVEGVYKNGGTVRVYFSAAANKFVQAEIYWSSEAKDIAVLRLPEKTTERKAMVLCPMKYVDLDDDFAALGYPAASIKGNDFPKFDTSDINVTKGGIAKSTRVGEREVYLLDLEISEGNSGGPLVNSKGQVVGINSFYIANDNQIPGKSNYAIAIDELLRNIDREIIPYTLPNDITDPTIVYIAAGGAVIIVGAVILIIALSKNKKKAYAQDGSQKVSSSYEAQNNQPQVTEPAKQPSRRSLVVNVTGLSGYFQGRSFKLDSQLKLGRDNNSCNIVFPIDHPGISGIHCKLTIDSNNVYLTDLGSSYGTFLSNGIRLVQNQPIKLINGDSFYLADETNKFEVRL